MDFQPLSCQQLRVTVMWKLSYVQAAFKKMPSSGNPESSSEVDWTLVKAEDKHLMHQVPLGSRVQTTRYVAMHFLLGSRFGAEGLTNTSCLTGLRFLCM